MIIIYHNLIPVTTGPLWNQPTLTLSSTNPAVDKSIIYSLRSLIFPWLNQFILLFSARRFFQLPFQGCVIQMEQRRAVFATIKADTDLLRRILIQRRLYGFQSRLHFLPQRCACCTHKPTAKRILYIGSQSVLIITWLHFMVLMTEQFTSAPEQPTTQLFAKHQEKRQEKWEWA